MTGEFFSFVFSLLVAASPQLALAPPAWERLRPALPSSVFRAAPGYSASDRAVSNWRREAATHLDLEPAMSAEFAAGGDPRPVARCVKLNNYWCIKGVGWNGMVAADPEGHAAFNSAAEGAAVAALLLRRYYLDFSRKSALDIVSRWAPAQCGLSPVRTTKFGPGFRVAQARVALGPTPGKRAAPLATRGLGNTLRARFLASHRPGFRARGPGLRRSVVPDRAPPMMRAPTIAAGLGESVGALNMPGPLALMNLAARVSPASFAPVTSCAGDGARIRNYAMKMIEGVAKSPDEDLKLFTPDGAPSETLARVMLNMAAVEIGPLRAREALVQAGIDTAAAAARMAAQARASTATGP